MNSYVLSAEAQERSDELLQERYEKDYLAIREMFYDELCKSLTDVAKPWSEWTPTQRLAHYMAHEPVFAVPEYMLESWLPIVEQSIDLYIDLYKETGDEAYRVQKEELGAVLAPFWQNLYHWDCRYCLKLMRDYATLAKEKL